MKNNNKKQNTQNTSKWSKTNGEWDHLPKDIYYKILKEYNTNFSKESLDYLYDRLGDTGFDPVHVFYLLATESSFQKNSKNNKSTAKGLTQITKDTFNTLFKEQGSDIYKQYIDGTRSEKDEINDAFVNIKRLDNAIKTRPDHRGYGRLKVNNLMPARRFNDSLSKDRNVYNNSLNQNQQKDLKDKWDSMTYEDLATYYDNDFSNWQNKWGLPKFDFGGIDWGSPVTAADINPEDYDVDDSNKWIEAGGGALSGASTGAAIGSIIPGIGTLVGAGIGALVGGISSWWKGRKAETAEEQSRKTALIAQAEANRQQIGASMSSKFQQDKLRYQQQNDMDSSNIVTRFGGLIGRKRMATGGQIVPNSSNTNVAYGRTHEQIDPTTGETGIAYNNKIEVEGGGYVNGKEYAGEVIRETPMGSQVFSDTLMVPQMKATYAEVAKSISDKKGFLEKQIVTLDKEINSKLDNLGKIKRNKLQTGTEIRNIEKLNFKMNEATGLVAKLEKDTTDLFNMQEQHATSLGLRPVGMQMKTGGVLPKAKMGMNEWGLVANIGNTLGSAAMSYAAYRNAMNKIAFERNLALPKLDKSQAVLFDPNEDVSSELQEIQSTFKQGIKYIQDNTKDPAIAQNRIAQLYIQSLQSKNKLLSEKRRAEKQTRNINLENLIKTLNQNKQIAYTNAMAEYQKSTGLNMAEQSANAQLWQNLSQASRDINQSFYDYTEGKMVSKGWNRGVTNGNNNTNNTTPNTPNTLPPITIQTYPMIPVQTYNKPLYNFSPTPFIPIGKYGGLVRKR